MPRVPYLLHGRRQLIKDIIIIINIYIALLFEITQNADADK